MFTSIIVSLDNCWVAVVVSVAPVNPGSQDILFTIEAAFPTSNQCQRTPEKNFSKLQNELVCIISEKTR